MDKKTENILHDKVRACAERLYTITYDGASPDSVSRQNKILPTKLDEFRDWLRDHPEAHEALSNRIDSRSRAVICALHRDWKGVQKYMDKAREDDFDRYRLSIALSMSEENRTEKEREMVALYMNSLTDKEKANFYDYQMEQLSWKPTLTEEEQTEFDTWLATKDKYTRHRYRRKK